MPGIDAKSDAIYDLVEEGSGVEQLATGFTFTEGPIWHPEEQVLYFSDMPADIRRKVGAGVQEVQRAFDRYYCVHGNPPDSIRVHKTTMDNLRLEAKRVGQNADGTLTLYGMKVTL